MNSSEIEGGGLLTESVHESVKMFASIEDQFECSGMCRPALFYYSLPINEYAFPH